MRKDPVEEEFFTPEGHADALVREAIQNSLDAAVSDDKPVKLRFYFSGPKPLAQSDPSGLFEGLLPHLKAPENLPTLENGGWTPSSPLSFLAIEDFGTRGLVGDPAASSHISGSDPNDFYYFFRNVGRSGKSATDRGRWGLGKTVFPAASAIRAFFGYTVRQQSPSALLMGQAVLKSHLIHDKLFDSYGFFGLFDGGMPQPVQDEEFRSSFAKTFGLLRRDHPGLSVVVPFPLSSIKPSAVLRSVVSHYFWAILANRLTVRVEEAGVPPTDVNAASIAAIAQSKGIEWASKSVGKRLPLKPPFDLAEWALMVGPAQRIEIAVQAPGSTPSWNEALFVSDQLKAVRSKWSLGERVAVRVQLFVHPKKEKAQQASFDVYLERDPHLVRAEDHYVRGGMAISGIRILKEPGVRGLVVVGDPVLSRLLGDAENPAHTEWPERGTKVGQRYDLGPSTVSFVKRSIESLVRIISTPEKEVEKNLLREVFYVQPPPNPEQDAPAPKGGKKPGAQPPPPIGPIQAVLPAPFSIEPRQGGFVVRGNGLDGGLSGVIRIDAAFAVRGGDPFKAYDPFDFDFASEKPITFETRGGEISKRERNRIEFVPGSADFELVATGFDPHRDLKVKVRSTPKSPETAE